MVQRHGKKGYAFFHIVVADQRAPRDGRKIEKLGVYNPNTNPATIDIDFDRTLDWMIKGAQPTDTCRAILSYKGVLYKKHLLDGVKKGAFSLEVAEERFAEWVGCKTDKVEGKRSNLRSARDKAETDRMKAESTVRENIAAKVLAKNSPLAEEAAVAPLMAEVAEEVPAEETTSETAAVEETAPVAAAAEDAAPEAAAE